MSGHLPRMFLRFARSSALIGIGVGIGLGLLVSCNQSPNSSNEQVRQQAAEATARAKEQSKQAVEDARAAAAIAEQKINAVTAGVKQGLNGKSPMDNARVDLNTAPESQMALLPGVSLEKAKQIADHRPYTSTHQLVDRGVLTERQFAAISPKVTVH